MRYLKTWVSHFPTVEGNLPYPKPLLDWFLPPLEIHIRPIPCPVPCPTSLRRHPLTHEPLSRLFSIATSLTPFLPFLHFLQASPKPPHILRVLNAMRLPIPIPLLHILSLLPPPLRRLDTPSFNM